MATFVSGDAPRREDARKNRYRFVEMLLIGASRGNRKKQGCG